jgi:hypothetical protein
MVVEEGDVEVRVGKTGSGGRAQSALARSIGFCLGREEPDARSRRSCEELVRKSASTCGGGGPGRIIRNRKFNLWKKLRPVDLANASFKGVTEMARFELELTMRIRTNQTTQVHGTHCTRKTISILREGQRGRQGIGKR